MKPLLQLNTLFISMVMEAIPFILVGVIVSGLIQTFVTEKWISRIVPGNRYFSILFGCGIGALFPSCECGIVPITRRLIGKGMPLHAGIAFMLTGPIINPIVLFATFIAFGNDWTMVAIRGGLAVVVAFVVAVVVSFLFKDAPIRRAESEAAAQTAAAVEPIGRQETTAATALQKCGGAMSHAIDEFFAVGKYLVLGAFVAAGMQTFLPTAHLLGIGHHPLAASLVMMAFAYVISLCSEADAFIASSFRSTFSTGALSAFLVFGPMVDIKNTIMLLSAFRGKFVAVLIGLIAVLTWLGSLLVGWWLA
ncbi:permease [Paenibacillus cymbidii]|uniref:permease n=1 Tax=Paenibacillus cymbidii TaxID=1639034 RepID=UPI00107FE54D|nr:permease [Paenibacillus cymbidii]